VKLLGAEARFRASLTVTVTVTNTSLGRPDSFRHFPFQPLGLLS
jgi:hypothetical protein